MSAGANRLQVAAPFFEDLEVGQVADAPSLTLTAGHAAMHQAILGDRLRLALDHQLASRVAGSPRHLAHPGLVWDVSIGQSTALTQRVIGNLFYRGLVFLRLPSIGDTLTTRTEVVALRQNRSRPGRAATGLAALRVRTVDQEGRPVLDFHRCAMLPLRDPDGETGRADDLDHIGADLPPARLAAAVPDWDLAAFRAAVPVAAQGELEVGSAYTIVGGDVVSSAPELARMTLNLATVHHDAGGNARGERLVYGGHTIGIALSQACRILPGLLTIVGWHSCDHLGPVREGDTLSSTVTLEHLEKLGPHGILLHLEIVTAVRRAASFEDVLRWRLVGLGA